MPANEPIEKTAQNVGKRGEHRSGEAIDKGNTSPNAKIVALKLRLNQDQQTKEPYEQIDPLTINTKI